MSDNAELITTASLVLYNLFKDEKVTAPISSRDLLTRVITSWPLNNGDTLSTPRFRLTDLSRFERTLSDLSQNWEHGTIQVRETGNNFLVSDVTLGTGLRLHAARKRKRVVDDDADSAAGSDQEDDMADADADAERDNSSENSAQRVAKLSPELQEVYALLQRKTAKGRLMAEQFHSDSPFEPICPYTTREECTRNRAQAALADPSTPMSSHCALVHFRPIKRPHTDPALGHCSYLNTCYSEPTYALSPSIPPLPSSHNHPRMATGTSGSAGAPNANTPVSLPSGLGAGGRGKEKAPCRYLHFEVDWDETSAGGVVANAYKNTKREAKKQPFKLGIGQGPTGKITEPLPPQWINCDIRKLDYSILGKFHVIMADPPWDIHMSLPYGTMTDDEMRAMPIPTLQDEGLIFLWVTGRAMEVGRECLRVWGYTRVDEVIWVKTNQLQRVIRTGRTGHWLNHTKEHMLIGLKTHLDKDGNLIWPSWVNRGLDTDVIVSEVRETSRKPDEVYGVIERMCPGGRKLEIFGRKHNTRPGWLTLGNQLGQDQIFEEDLAERVRARYPERVAGTLAGASENGSNIGRPGSTMNLNRTIPGGPVSAR